MAHSSFAPRSGQPDRATGRNERDVDQAGPVHGGSPPDASSTAPMAAETIRVALVDCLSFSRDCLTRALAASHPSLIIVPFAEVDACIAALTRQPDVILYHSHDYGPFDAQGLRQAMALRDASGGIPIIVLSDTTSALQPKTIRSALANGIQGFIPTRTTDMSVAFAAIRLVKEGGTFVPIDLLMTSHEERLATAADALTPRQTAVLSLLQQGKPNKIIAYDLGMTESTVKVHIRNIMRKMGATNRTQAVYKAQQLWATPRDGLDRSMRSAA
jgi:DNA-binding NarL/FixJ family response regulator